MQVERVKGRSWEWLSQHHPQLVIWNPHFAVRKDPEIKPFERRIFLPTKYGIPQKFKRLAIWLSKNHVNHLMPAIPTKASVGIYGIYVCACHCPLVRVSETYMGLKFKGLPTNEQLLDSVCHQVTAWHVFHFARTKPTRIASKTTTIIRKQDPPPKTNMAMENLKMQIFHCHVSFRECNSHMISKQKMGWSQLSIAPLCHLCQDLVWREDPGDLWVFGMAMHGRVSRKSLELTIYLSLFHHVNWRSGPDFLTHLCQLLTQQWLYLLVLHQRMTQPGSQNATNEHHRRKVPQKATPKKCGEKKHQKTRCAGRVGKLYIFGNMLKCYHIPPFQKEVAAGVSISFWADPVSRSIVGQDAETKSQTWRCLVWGWNPPKNLPSLKLTASLPLKIGRNPIGKDRIPTIHL